ncbi:replication protein, partial [Salmonella enterica subsp. enterica serovar 1,4,[5],12:i:-]|nr:replication protein [Salmonella enterica subsp. enterica serovar 1,4,[5],12:i:-]MCY5377561.1 replication protein [Salmonella enterica subsp. enterica serovar 1,4,[5],12:i:-]MCY5561335.1 replication protein [Salmonella enterica subsp. enterica serovar 1,4,[5],12:i:-]MCY6029730.1 replication protein [Salmonella enterica subsp. enterica serovar 1,4,[5],12:i:-]
MSMSNTAEIYKFPAPIPTQQECRMADLENGYLRLANQIQDALCIVELSGREFRVLNAIIRLTYGWSKKSDRIANSLIADKTTLKVKHVSEAVLSLAYRNIIILRRIGQTRYIGINTNLDKWAYSKPHCSKCPVSFPDDEIATWIISVLETRDSYPRKGGRASPKTGIVIPENRDSVLPHSAIPENGDSYPRKEGRASPKTGNTKDIIPKTNIKDLTPFNPPKGKVKFDPLSIPVPEWLNAASWNEWVTYRQQSGKPIKTELTVTKAFRLLKECLDEGHDPVNVINTSIAN